MGRRKTTEQFRAEVFQRAGDDYEVVGEYVGAHQKLEMKHRTCSYTYPVTPGKFLQGRRCPKCHRGYTLTTEEFRDIVRDLTGDAYSVESAYKGTDYHIRMKHFECGYQWKVLPMQFTGGSRCPKCAGNTRKTQQKFEREVREHVGAEYLVVGEYANTSTPIEMLHQTCGAVYQVSPAKFLSGGRCPSCMNILLHERQKKTAEQFKAEVFDLVGAEFAVISGYRGAYQPIRLKHIGCQKEFELSAARNFLIHPKCRRCSEKESKGEKQVRRYIEKQNWNYKVQHRFPDCRHRYPLPFDFAIFNCRQQLQFLIEYDGHHHYHAVDIFGGEAAYQKSWERDLIKSAYCERQGIPLLRIPYFKLKELEGMMERFLKVHQLRTTDM